MKDRLSALLDGELDDESMRPIFDAMRRNASLRTDWEAYCLIGDALRGERGGTAGFIDRVMAGLDREATVLSPPPAAPPRPSPWASLMPLAASLMGVVAVGWVAHTLYAVPDGVASVADAASRMPVQAERVAVRPVSTVPVPVSADPHRAYVFVHQATTAGGPISGAIQHVRTISDSVRDDAR